MAHAVFDLIVLGAALQMLDQGVLERRHILRVQAWLEVAQDGRDVFRGEAEQLLNLRVMNLVGLQVPVPQPQLAGLQRQRQARFAFAQGLIGGVQLAAALSDTVFQVDLRFAQLAFGATPLLDFPRQLLIELFAARLRLLKMFDQVLILKAPQQTTINQAIDLPRHHAQRAEQNQAQPAPAARLLVAAPEQIADRRQQARQGK